MSNWKLNLWPTTRSASHTNDIQLDYQWDRDDQEVSVLPPVLEAGDQLKIYFSYAHRGEKKNVVPDGQLTATLAARGSTPPLELVSPDGTSLPGGFCCWQVELPPVTDETIFRFRVTVATTGSSSPYTVDPEMVIEPTTGPPDIEEK